MTKSGRIEFIGLTVLAAVFLFIGLESINWPPVSDSWEMLRFFHRSLDRPEGWLHILNHDPFENIRFQPFSRIFYFALHNMFGSEFGFFHIANMVVYFLAQVLLWVFAGYFIRSRVLRFCVPAVNMFLFSHFDMVFWASHIYILSGFCFILGGFICFISYLRGRLGRSSTLLCAVLLLCGVLCYEAFWLLPFALPVIAFIDEESVRNNAPRSALFILAGVFAVCLWFFFFTRSLETYPDPVRTLSSVFKPLALPLAFIYAGFNVLYNCMGINSYPFAAFPLDVAENIYMGGTVINFFYAVPSGGQTMVLVLGSAFGISAVWTLVHFIRRGSKTAQISAWLFYLLISPLVIIFFCRLSTNPGPYGFTEFRYQFLPNSFGMVLFFFLLEKCWNRIDRNRRRLLAGCLVVVMAMNIVCILRVKTVYRQQLGPLSVMLDNIRTGIADGSINPNARLFISPDITYYLPSLCWNMDIGQWFMDEGTYEWLFRPEEIKCFSFVRHEADFEIDPGREFEIVALGNTTGGKIINETKSRFYIDLPKDEKFLDLARSYISYGNIPTARKMLRQSLEFNPGNREAGKLLETTLPSKIGQGDKS